MQGVYVKLNPELPWQKQHSTRRKIFSPANWLLDDLKEKKRYWKLKEEALDSTLWGTRFGRGYGPVVTQATE
jgi:hypothetical protein